MTPLIRATFAWGIGIGLARYITAQGQPIPWPVVGLLTLPAIGALLLYRTEPHLKSIAVLALVGLAGVSRFLIAQPHIDERHIAFFNDAPQPITLTGTVADFPDVRPYHVNLRLEAETIRIGDEVQPVEGLVLVRAARYPEFSYGDRLEVQGRPETPPIFEDFSYRDYLARFDIYTIIRRPQVALVESNQGNPFWAMMFDFKKQAAATLNQLLAEPFASLLNGILLGIRSGIPDDLYEQFNSTGTSHVIVISGSNISLIAGIFLLLGRRLFGRKMALPLAIGGVVIYTFLVGADASVSRAAVMGVLFVVAL
ncbi:MAG: ComEC family competence protein, partial [Anaerolineae bacterium]|nr:ComEC family competence protein [Anaerolineae bacterium]